ncbi:hypothetical protein C8R45DRAFT_1211703 [Mycena sanguinolenta]|nr:hypothetical protein C8R45DRAFT_1211703 [Mycena sanguinolenta]
MPLPAGKFSWIDQLHSSPIPAGDSWGVFWYPGDSLIWRRPDGTLAVYKHPDVATSTATACSPPNLNRLRIIRHDEGTVLDHPIDSVDYTRIPGIPPPFALRQHLPRLHHLDVVVSPWDGYTIEPLWAKRDRRDYVKRLGEDYHARGIRLDIFSASSGSFVPPYLFGEEVPCEEPVYRAENAWFSPEMT